MKYEIEKQTFIMQNTLIYLKIPQEKFEYLILSDEAYFYLTNRICDIERPTDGIEKPLHLFFFSLHWVRPIMYQHYLTFVKFLVKIRLQDQ
jgi:hypothetical protein